MDEKEKKLKQIKKEIFELVDSPLYQQRVKDKVWPIIGEGNHGAELLLIGEAPGREEVKVGRPFVGKSGQVLIQLLSEISIKREDVYITSLVKDRPPGNRKPTIHEIEIYSPFTKRQIDLIKPKLIASLGATAMKWVWENYGMGELGNISKIHGNIYQLARCQWGMELIPLFHPSVALYEPYKINLLREDMKKVRSKLNTI